MCSSKQICNVAPAMFRETSQGGELDNLTLYVEKVARKYGPRGGKVWVNFELKCETTCVCNNIAKLFGSARVKAKDVIVPDDCLGS